MQQNKTLTMYTKTIKTGLAVSVASVAMWSCTKDDPAVLTENYSVPDTYSFSNAGQSSVDLSTGNGGYLKLNEFNTLAKKFSPTLNGNGVKSLYTTDIKPFTAVSKDFFNGGNAESEEIKNFFSGEIDKLITAAASNTTNAAQGVAGLIMDGSKKRLVDAKGVERDQVLQKGLMGAFLMDRILNEHLGDKVMKSDALRNANNSRVMVSGKNYTELEHHWDTAYGYLGLNKPNDVNSFWANYLSQQLTNTPIVNGMREKLDEAFRKGRAAASAKDYAVMEEQIQIIRNGLNLVNATRCVYYLNKRPAAGTDITAGFHAWSEALGFLHAMRYNKKADGSPVWTKAELQGLAVDLVGTNGFWEETRLLGNDDNQTGTLKNIAKRVAAKYGFNYADIH